VMLFGSILLSHSKTINAKVISFLNLQYILKVVIKQLYNFLTRAEQPKNMKKQ